MKRPPLTLMAAVLVLLTNAVALAGAWWNRQGEPSAELLLSERELGLPYYWRNRIERENSGLALELKWRLPPASEHSYQGSFAPNSYYREADWLDEAELRALGFEVDPPTAQEASWQWRRQLPRAAWLVLEFDGAAYQQSLQAFEAWADWVEQASDEEIRRTIHGRPSADEIARQRREHRESASRLFVIDAGLDPLTLRQRYPDRQQHAVVSGTLRVHYGSSLVGQANRWRAQIEQLDVDTLHVSTRWRQSLQVLQAASAAESARFQARVAWGRRHEPWLLDLQPGALPANPAEP